MADATKAQNPPSRNIPSQARLKELFDYDPDVGHFVRRKGLSAKGASAGQIAGTIDHSGYIKVSVDGHRYYAHRLAWIYMTGDSPPPIIDHANHNRSDNRWSNLRAASQSENVANSSLSKASTTGFKGVSPGKRAGSFRAYIFKNRRQIWLGYFPSAELASAAREKAARQIYGEFACAG